MITENAFATILLCSYLGAKEGDYKPFTALQWSSLVTKIVNSALKEPAALLNLSQDEIYEKLDVSTNEANRIRNLLSRGGNMAFTLEDLDRKGVKIVTRSDKHYPSRLKSLLKKHAPALLYYCGDLSLANYKGIAIVGSRDIDKSGETFATDLATKATKEGLAVFSGGARGIDTISEKAALDNGGRVVSVLSDSLIKKIRKKEIRDKVTNGQLLLLTANNPDAPFTASGAMNRNKYVYALSKGAFVVASAYNKGGTWAGATENLKNEWVKTFVLECKNYDGNLALIKRGAKPIVSLEAIKITELIDKAEQKLEQLNILNMNINYTNDHKSFSVNERENKYEVTSKIPEKTDFDLYNKVIDVVLKYLEEPKSLDEVCESLNINKTQATTWLNRAIEEKKVKKLNKPIRYITVTIE